PQLGFVGFNSSLFTTLTSEVAANWLVAYAEQRLALPSMNEMIADMDLMEKWRTGSRPIASEFSGTCVAPFNYYHLDLLMRDMGLKRKLSLSPFEYLKPIDPKDYHQLLRGKRKSMIRGLKTEPEYQFY
ncbi:MAG: hypothetical protein J7578_05415, partial [Chitinophagaceae bacterium]|nr:hypothetical protein [Chitinophagaceae bacterium]